MSAYPVMLDGSAITAVVIGGGRVATRKALALLESGARVHVVAPSVTAELDRRVTADDRLRVSAEPYRPEHLNGATLVIVATDDAMTNAAVAHDARGRVPLINVVDAPGSGNFSTPAVYRTGEVVVAVTAGGVPRAAVLVRDQIAACVDERYGAAVEELAALRRELLERGDRARWAAAAGALLDEHFMDRVKAGTFSDGVAVWR